MSFNDFFEKWLDEHPPEPKEASIPGPIDHKTQAAEQRRKLRKAKPQAQLDLHGMTRKEAIARLDEFFVMSRRKGLKKVLIIHGKGKHSTDGGVLKKTAIEYFQKSRYAGEFGSPGKELGGSGATWVIVK
jgi:DNA-nicking Smr family endonuclease